MMLHWFSDCVDFMREGVKAISLVHLSVCLFVSLSGEKFLNLNIDRMMISKTDSTIDIVKKVSYVYLTGSKAVLYPLLFQQFPI